MAQVGLASDKAQYIHRLGRTARAGKNGKGMLLLGDFEERFLNSLSELPLTEAPPVPANALAEAQALVQQGLAAVDEEDKAQVRAILYKSVVPHQRSPQPAPCSPVPRQRQEHCCRVCLSPLSPLSCMTATV